jgi:1-aminocyclopropane-1-carboxylate deaminase/D-cysteine desulfhydrase-like pyridoxal-dependent ACC family enzyme
MQRLPRAKVDITPTPLQDCTRLSEALGGPRILIKRDDLTGLAYGGTKTRSIGFIMGEALAEGADTIIVFGFAKLVSNHCRLVTAAAARLGLRAILVLGGQGVRKEQSNALLCHLLGAEVRLVDTEDIPTLNRVCADMASELRGAGRKPFVIGVDKFYGAYGAVGSVDCFLEIMDQLDALHIEADYLYLTSQGGTQAGFVLAREALQTPMRVVSISSMPAGLRSWPGRVELHADIAQWANDLAAILGINVSVSASNVVNHTDYVGGGYGVLSPACAEAMRLVAQTEAIILDPLYTGKGMAGLIDHIRTNRMGVGETVVFIHTGGLPTVFDYGAELAR